MPRQNRGGGTRVTGEGFRDKETEKGKLQELGGGEGQKRWRECKTRKPSCWNWERREGRNPWGGKTVKEKSGLCKTGPPCGPPPEVGNLTRKGREGRRTTPKPRPGQFAGKGGHHQKKKN